MLMTIAPSRAATNASMLKCDGASGEHLRATGMTGSDLEAATPGVQAEALLAIFVARRLRRSPAKQSSS